MVHPAVHHLTLLGEGRSHHSDPLREGHRALLRLGPINQPVHTHSALSLLVPLRPRSWESEKGQRRA